MPSGLNLNPGPVFPAIVTLGPTIPSTGSIVIFSVPDWINAIFGVAGFKVIVLLLTVAVKVDPMLHPPIVPLEAVKTPLFTDSII